MLSTFGTTLAELQGTILARCNMSGSTAPDQFIPLAELTQYINASYAEFQGVIVKLNELQYITSSMYTFPATGSIPNAQPLPTNFANMAGVERSLDGSGNEGTWYNICRFDFKQRNFGNNAAWPLIRTGIDVMYSTYDWQLVIQPALATQGVYRIWFYPQAPQLVNPTDTFDDQQGWYEYVVTDCCMKVLAKQGEDVSVFAAQKASMLERIRSLGGNRDFSAPKLYGRSQSGGYGRGGGPGGSGWGSGYGGGFW